MCLVIRQITQVDVQQEVKEGEQVRKRAPQMKMFKVWQLRKHLGPLFGKIESHFRLKRPGTNTEVDANITALKMFFTIIADVLVYTFIFNHILLLME